ncbi:MAG: SpoIIE family protein phosphatase [Leptospiraceae bacterium]|nr:SpoIIE family protein phosphatase [Leptospiraceae bacterium]MDW7975983.1 SpoIIE family protein phosphatase [Leptospiraceae bacterium]
METFINETIKNETDGQFEIDEVLVIEEQKEDLIDPSAFLEIKEIQSPIFSANEVGKVCLTIPKLKSLTGYDYSRLPLETTNTSVIYEIFHHHPKLDFLPIVNENGWIKGYFTRKSFLSLISENTFNRELLFRKDVTIKNLYNQNVICLNAYSSLTEASEILMSRPPQIRFDPFVVTLDRKFFGISTVDNVLLGMNTFIKRDLEAVKESQLSLMNFYEQHHKRIEKQLEYTDFLRLLLGPGGDYVYKYEIDDNYSLVVLIDVCGKGLKAASMILVIISILNKIIQDFIRKNNISYRNFYKALQDLNDEVAISTSKELYATGVFILVNKKNKVMTVYDYGHGMLWLKRNHKVYALKSETKSNEAVFLGLFENTVIEPVSYKLKEGDIVFSCSDGLTEQLNDEKIMFMEILPDVLNKFGKDVQKNKKILLKSWSEFRKNRKIRDDISFFIFKV